MNGDLRPSLDGIPTQDPLIALSDGMKHADSRGVRRILDSFRRYAMRTQWGLLVACVITGADYDIALESCRRDRWLIISEALVLSLVGLLLWSAWTITIATFSDSRAVAMGGATLVAGLMFMLDRFISLSDSRLSGVLGTPMSLLSNAKYVGLMGLRIGVAAVLSLGTATGLTMAMFKGRIDTALQQERIEANAPLVDALRVRSERAERQLLGTLETDVETLRAQFASAAARQQEAETQLNEATRSAHQARLDMDSQLHGDAPPYKPGEGPMFREWKRRETLAEQTSATATAVMQAAMAQQESLKAEIAAKQQAIVTARAQLAGELEMLRTQTERDPRWLPERTDPLSRYATLQRLKRDPRDGDATRYIAWGANVAMLMLELSFLLIKLCFAPATVYKLRLITAIRLEAAAVSHRYDRDLAASRGGATRAVLRVIKRDDSAPCSPSP